MGHVGNEQVYDTHAQKKSQFFTAYLLVEFL